MNSVTNIKNYTYEDIAVITQMQRRYRHVRYLKNAHLSYSYRKELKIREIEESEFPSIGKIVEKWRNQSDKETQIIFRGMLACLDENSSQCIGAFGNYRKLQGLLFLSQPKDEEATLEIDFLATAPHNNNKNPAIIPEFRRVATALIEYAIHLASRKPQENLLVLTPVNHSASFYKSRLFHFEGVKAYLAERQRVPFLQQFGGRALLLPTAKQ